MNVSGTPLEFVEEQLNAGSVNWSEISERTFPGERWLIGVVEEEDFILAQTLAGGIEESLNASFDTASGSFVVMFRKLDRQPLVSDPPSRAGRLFTPAVDGLIQLLEARSRTSDALPSLKYVEDPRASLVAVGASRHQFMYGRRGVGKTALLLEAKRRAERAGHITVWVNAHVLRGLTSEESFSVVAERVLLAIKQHGGSSRGASFKALEQSANDLAKVREAGGSTARTVSTAIPGINEALRGILREGMLRLYVYIDDFYLLPLEVQPGFLDNLAGILRDCDGWMKIASIERLTKSYEPSSKKGLEIPHDASKIEIDVTLEDPAAAEKFLESILQNYTASAGLGSPSSVAKQEALGRLVLASGGVPRDYLNLFASSILVAREFRTLAREVGREDVSVAAGRSANIKKRDLELDVADVNTVELLSALTRLSDFVKQAGYAYFKIDRSEKNHAGYELLALLVDLRFAHVVQSALSDQHKSGVRYEAYALDLSEWADVRLKRGLHVLDLESGAWFHRLSGQAKSKQKLTQTMLRDRLRTSPLVPMSVLDGTSN